MTTTELLPHLPLFLSAVSGVIAGLAIGLVGGGGSVLGVPLMVYLVGVSDAHLAIGTSAFAVAVNAALGLYAHARTGHVKWRCGGMYAAAGVLGAFAGSTIGKMIDGRKLLFLFALVMILIGVVMLRRRGEAGAPEVECTIEKAPKVFGFGVVTGLFAGFFGIGGGFLVVPGLVGATGMPLINAVGTSLIAVTGFGLTTAANYALAGLVDWPLAAAFIGGGALGAAAGSRAAHRLPREHLSIAFSFMVFGVAAYILWRSLQ
jgi:uncharacterized protein